MFSKDGAVGSMFNRTFSILMGDMLHAPHILLLEAELII